MKRTQVVLVLISMQLFVFACNSKRVELPQTLPATSPSSARVTDSIAVEPRINTMSAIISFRAVKVAMGGSHCLVLDQAGMVWGAGANAAGQLGLESVPNQNYTRFKQVGVGVRDLAAGSEHSFLIKADGSLWASGHNAYGELGAGNTRPACRFEPVMAGVKAVTCRGYSSLIIKSDGTLWATGRNENYALGIGDMDKPRASLESWMCLTPVQVLTGVNAASLGGRHSLALKSDGTLWVAGDNSSGQLGWKNGAGDSETATVNYSKKFIQMVSGVSAASAGGLHSLVLKQDGTLWATGSNEYGQLGTGDNYDRHEFAQVLSDVAAIAAGNQFSLALKKDGTLWAAGGKGFGEFRKYNILDNKKRNTFVQVLADVIAMDASWEWGTLVGSCLAVKRDGSIWGIGGNGNGEFGIGNYAQAEEWTELIHY